MELNTITRMMIESMIGSDDWKNKNKCEGELRVDGSMRVEYTTRWKNELNLNMSILLSGLA